VKQKEKKYLHTAHGGDCDGQVTSKRAQMLISRALMMQGGHLMGGGGVDGKTTSKTSIRTHFQGLW
jgi:hypothetical protein